jgi:Flp pilus assembly protein TadG
VELALTLPILLVIVFGIIDFGRVINTEMTLNEASREAARALVFGQSALTRAQLVTGTSGTTVTASTACPASPTATSTASVTLSQTYTYVSPIMALLGSAATTKTLTSTGVMACIG